ncbi:Cation_ATPase_N domain-containing protein [Meloidogyne graminicola]|uniref:Calcium-transporting ATPase n=1 Tax=Meloidogyne graminicola TaxID=189291 RepID=A0A8S9ZV74_9BILA|nr:Cation_ATPase_N domain-containing protein [Meloidogyne graminicola]
MKVFEKNGPYISVLNNDNNKLTGTQKNVFNDGGGGGGGKGGGNDFGFNCNNKMEGNEKIFGSINQQRKTSKSVGIKEDISSNWPSKQILCKLMESRGTDIILKLNEEFGGIDGLCNKMGVDPLRGLTSDTTSPELIKRREKYGSNTIPSTKAKPFLRLLFDAIKDPTLIILIVAGFVSLLLSFVEPGQGGGAVENNNSTTDFGGNVSTTLLGGLNETEIINGLRRERNWNASAKPLPFTLPNISSSNIKPPDISQPKEEHESAWIEGVAILVCVIVVCLVTAINDYSKERQFRNLQAKIETGQKFSVIRDGEPMDIPVSDLVVGDIARVKYGDLIPADGLIVQSNDLKVDESSLTGESEHVTKSLERDIALLSGTYAMEGSAKMLITAVGVNSQTGIIMTLLGGGRPDISSSISSDSDTTSYSSSSSSHSSSSSSSSSSSNDENMDDIHSKSILQTKLSALALQIIYCGTSVAVLALLVLVIPYCIREYSETGSIFKLEHLHNFVKFFIIAVTILVISIPEGLPLAIALSLTYSVRKMMLDNNLVRHLDACETMGNATTICSDKTGTLTTNRMTVVQSYTCGHLFNSEKSQPSPGELPQQISTLLSEAITLNCAYNSMIVEPKKPGERLQQLGNKTECGLLGWIKRFGGDYEEIRKEFPEEKLYKVYTFNSSRKMMMTVIQLKNKDCDKIIGASEILLNHCKFFVGVNGNIEEFKFECRERLLRQVIQKNGRRCRNAINSEIQINSEEDICWENEHDIASDLIGLAICGIQDPVRDEVPAAIEKCRRAGITVRMVTGDNVMTARAIAIQCGILNPGDDFLVLDGKEFNKQIKNEQNKVDQAKFDQIWPRLRVLARAQPTDKYILVKGIIDSKLNPQREIVAVTGDGTNDGPALKKADVGFAMGIAGTDVAKEASDIILTDDNFTSIVKAVMWGRNFQLTVNMVAVLTAFISACTIGDSPLKAVHMLWLNLIMDTLASLALATEMPTEELLQRKPYGRKKPLISRTMIKNIGCHALFQLSVLIFLVFQGPTLLQIPSGIGAALYAPPSVHFTVIFNAFVMMTLFNEINSRKVHGERNVFKHLLSNRMFCVIWISTFIGQILIIQFGGKWFSTASLNKDQWLICLGLGLFELILGQIVATIPSKKVLPKWLTFYRGIPIVKRKVNMQENTSMAVQRRPISRGYILWVRGVELIGIHYKVCRTLHENLLGRRLGMTAPKMTAEAAEKWRQIYHHYKHQKHIERKLRRESNHSTNISPVSNNTSNGIQTLYGSTAQTLPATNNRHLRRFTRKILMRPKSLSFDGENVRKQDQQNNIKKMSSSTTIIPTLKISEEKAESGEQSVICQDAADSVKKRKF